MVVTSQALQNLSRERSMCKINGQGAAGRIAGLDRSRRPARCVRPGSVQTQRDAVQNKGIHWSTSGFGSPEVQNRKRPALRGASLFDSVAKDGTWVPR
jgi:hypothetical protein